jgi:hypothetical protein
LLAKSGSRSAIRATLAAGDTVSAALKLSRAIDKVCGLIRFCRAPVTHFLSTDPAMLVM